MFEKHANVHLFLQYPLSLVRGHYTECYRVSDTEIGIVLALKQALQDRICHSMRTYNSYTYSGKSLNSPSPQLSTTFIPHGRL